MEQTGVLGKGDAAALHGKDRDSFRHSLGIADPLGDYQKSLSDLLDAKQAGAINDDEFGKRNRALRKQAVGAMMGDERSVTPIAAMQAGSREAYSLLVNQQLSDPKTQLAKQSLSKLDQIEKNTRRAGDGGGETLDF